MRAHTLLNCRNTCMCAYAQAGMGVPDCVRELVGRLGPYAQAAAEGFGIPDHLVAAPIAGDSPYAAPAEANTAAQFTAFHSYALPLPTTSCHAGETYNKVDNRGEMMGGFVSK
eukprot:1059372-Pelagomonas_calceolata.AAC.1